MNRPTPDLSQEGNRHSAASSAFPSWEGIEVGSSSRFKGKRERRLPRIDPAADLTFTIGNSASRGKVVGSGEKVASGCECARAPLPRRLRLPLGLLALATVVAIILAVCHNRFARFQTPLSIPVPRDLALLDAQLRAYLQAKIIWVKEKPRNAGRQATLGIAYAANGLWDEARNAFRNVERLDPKQPLAPMYVAIATQELGQLKEAIRLFRELTVRFPDFAPGYYRLGDASLRAGEVPQAEVAFRRLISLAPAEWRGYAGLGDVKLRGGQFAEAAKELEKSVQLAPDEKIAHHLLGLAYRGLGRARDAELELNRGLNAQHYPMTDEWEATAAQHMKRLPDLYDMARHYSAAGNPGKAAEILEEALAFHPADLGVMSRLAVAYHQSGQPQKGRELLLQVVAKDSRNLPAHIALANSCAALGASAEALAYATRATELGTNVAEAHLAKANALLAAERDNEALGSLESAFRCDPQNAEIQLTMGDVCLQNLDQPEEALRHYRAAVTLDPAFVSGYVRIAEMEIERGEAGRAREAVELIGKLSPESPLLKTLEARLTSLEPKKAARE